MTAEEIEFTGTAAKDESVGELTQAGTREVTDNDRRLVERANEMIREGYALLDEVFTKPMPVGKVQWIHISNVRCNDYNPNAVAQQEMKLLHTSISEDGYTQPVVAIEDDDKPGTFVIVDGYHRYTTMRRYADIHDSTAGYLPVVVLDKSIADRIASTVRHNRARGKHSIGGMSNLVFQMLTAGESDETVCNKLGLEAEELARLKHITGFSKLFAHLEHSPIVITKTQVEEKAAYKKQHPEESIPQW